MMMIKKYYIENNIDDGEDDCRGDDGWVHSGVGV